MDLQKRIEEVAKAGDRWRREGAPPLRPSPRAGQGLFDTQEEGQMTAGEMGLVGYRACRRLRALGREPAKAPGEPSRRTSR